MQLTQSVEALRHVLAHTGRSPGSVLLAGDSAGANITVGVLSHLAHPHPSILPVHLSEPLAGAATIAPWVSLHPDLSEHVIYDGGDIVTTFVGEKWSKEFMGGAEPDYYTDAIDAPESWFETFPINKMLILAGENEILLPMIEMFYEKMKVSSSFSSFSCPLGANCRGTITLIRSRVAIPTWSCSRARENLTSLLCTTSMWATILRPSRARSSRLG